MQLETKQYTAKGRAAGCFGLLSRFLVVLFAAAMPLAPIASVLAQQPAQTAGQKQGVAAIIKTQMEIAIAQPGTVRATDTNAIRPFRIKVPQEALNDLR